MSCHRCSILFLEHENRHKQYANKWVTDKTLFIKTKILEMSASKTLFIKQKILEMSNYDIITICIIHAFSKVKIHMPGYYLEEIPFVELAKFI